MLEYCMRIGEIMGERGEDIEEFMSDRDYQELCAWQLSQIGEASSQVDSMFKGRYPEVEWQEAVKFRNVLIHNYGNIDLSLVWFAMVEDIPTLRKQCERIILENEDEWMNARRD